MTTRDSKPSYSVGEEVAHALSHGVGLVASLGGLAALVTAAHLRGDARLVVACAVFGATLVLLYAASTLYHGLPGGRARRAKRVLQRIDRAAIFVLIAGTYTPFALVSLRGVWGWTLLGLAWSLAAVGVALEASRSRRFSLPLYLGMGWMGIVALGPLARAIHPGGLLLLLLGGLAYTSGLIFYAWPRLPHHHTVWHVFVLAGSACHFFCVLGYVVPQAA